MSKRIHWMDVQSLASLMLGHPDDWEGDVDQEFLDRFEIDLEQFQKVVEALIPFTIPAKTAMTETVCRGFVHDGAFIVRVCEGDEDD